MTAILATADEPFRTRVIERLLAAGYEDLEIAELPAALADLLRETKQPLVVVGGTWPAPQAFLRVAVNAGALPLVLLDASELDAEGEALAMGARAALQSDIPASSLAAAMAAVDSGLIVLEPSARALLLTANRERHASDRAARVQEQPTEERLGRDQFDGGLPSGDKGGRDRLGEERLLSGERLGRNRLAREQFSEKPNERSAAERVTHERLVGLAENARNQSNGTLEPRRSRPLTSREREILALVASGTSNKGVARTLSVSANTVKFHLAAVFDKLNAATRAEAVAEAIRRGELSL